MLQIVKCIAYSDASGMRAECEYGKVLSEADAVPRNFQREKRTCIDFLTQSDGANKNAFIHSHYHL